MENSPTLLAVGETGSACHLLGQRGATGLCFQRARLSRCPCNRGSCGRTGKSDRRSAEVDSQSVTSTHATGQAQPTPAPACHATGSVQPNPAMASHCLPLLSGHKRGHPYKSTDGIACDALLYNPIVKCIRCCLPVDSSVDKGSILCQLKCPICRLSDNLN